MPNYQVSISAEEETYLTREVADRVPVPTIQQVLQFFVNQQVKEIVARNKEHDESNWIVAIRSASAADRQQIKTILGL